MACRFRPMRQYRAMAPGASGISHRADWQGLEPLFDPAMKWFENRVATEGKTGPYRGFEHMELAMRGPMGKWHYAVAAQEFSAGRWRLHHHA